MSPATVLPPPGEVLEIILGAGASARQIQEAIPDIPALRPRPHVKASGGGDPDPQRQQPHSTSDQDTIDRQREVRRQTHDNRGHRRHDYPASRTQVAQIIPSQAGVLKSGRQPQKWAARPFLESTELGGSPNCQPERVWELALVVLLPFRLALPCSIPRIVLRARLEEEEGRNNFKVGPSKRASRVRVIIRTTVCASVLCTCTSHASQCQQLALPAAAQAEHHVGSADLGL